ncbi:phosphonate ABC transporter, permease protein PhnE [Iningainema tapete]|uniref:Phosphonate ABC transporter, permease protein PhnE n=1 Tax=Iningainema tapete BLCC-T55 TaxID=2748662 RepID=A0A8J6XSA4_9CYAN|nr:phosphonate ABC transporter, permease protein PhnE [Iningainema tapete]MBD2772708.1 phosphonate ABC transporter, permease protein PhnE [Iningainema tapete BLCC-T55]
MKTLTWKWHWPSHNGLPPLSLIALLLVILLALGSTAALVEVDLVHIFQSTGRLFEFTRQLFAVPNWSYLPTLGTKMLETLEIAFLSTTLALILSLPLGILAARNSSLHPIVYHCSRNLLSVMRALPEVVWALIFVSAVGLGALPGVMALTFVTTGFMAKFFAESIEVVNSKAIEGITATGANWLQVINFAMLPQAFPDLIGTVLYILDHNLRTATIVGLVGAGGIGYELVTSIRLFNYSQLVMIVLTIYLAVTVLDRVSNQLRSRVI